MLNTESSPTAWRGLSVPQRVAIVIDRARLIGGSDQVLDRHFTEAPETCDLDLEIIRANIGKAIQLLEDEGAPVAVYDRAKRLMDGVALVTGLLPTIPAIHLKLREAGYDNRELGDLWDDLIKGAAESFQADRAPMVGMSDWARDMLSRNAN